MLASNGGLTTYIQFHKPTISAANIMIASSASTTPATVSAAVVSPAAPTTISAGSFSQAARNAFEEHLTTCSNRFRLSYAK